MRIAVNITVHHVTPFGWSRHGKECMGEQGEMSREKVVIIDEI